MINGSLFWVLWGVLIAFVVQVFYDYFGECINGNATKKTALLKFFAGVLIIAVLGIIVGLASI
jgi:hypothetical protein